MRIRMATKLKRKPNKKRISFMKKPVAEPKSTGTRIAEKNRAKGNGYSETKRQRLLDRGMALIYGGPGYVKSNGNRG